MHQKKSKSSDIIITQALYTCKYELRVAVSSSCYCKLGDWNSNSLKFKMLKQKTRSDSYCMDVAELKKKCTCRNIRNLPSAWNLNALKMNFWIMPDQKKRAGVIKSLHPQVHWYTVHVQLVQYELGPFFLLSKKPGVFTM